MFGKTEAQSVEVNSPTELQALAPPGEANATVTITLTTESGTAQFPNAVTYTDVVVPPWATMLEAAPDPLIVRDQALRERILATNRPWRIRDRTTQIEMLLVPHGTYLMGCSSSDSSGCSGDETPIHQVTISQPFYLGRFEVKQSEYSAIMGTASSNFLDPQRPVDSASWNSIQPFLAATGLRLPTEAEWEYAYRAGTTSAYHSSEGWPAGFDQELTVDDIGWFAANNIPSFYYNQTKPGGLKAANGLGLFDMSGNVNEWVSDRYGPYASGPQVDPQGATSGNNRVWRGGAWDYPASNLRASKRFANLPGLGYFRRFGFRVARNP
jgi:formylglycine-generating enzyme required for sulfatase activity